MNTSASHIEPRLLTNEELGAVIRLLREIRQWSQEQLADISKLSARTIQRVENGEGGSSDTRRALAIAFDFEDIDALIKPFAIPSQAQLDEQRKKFEQENITLKVEPLTTGRQIGRMVEGVMGLQMSEVVELSCDAAAAFAELTDYLQEYAECHELYSATSKLSVYEDLSGILARLTEVGISLVGTQRNMVWKNGDNNPGTPIKVAYLATFRKGAEPEHIAVPKQQQFG